jgi:hypothetical protein
MWQRLAEIREKRKLLAKVQDQNEKDELMKEIIELTKL